MRLVKSENDQGLGSCRNKATVSRDEFSNFGMRTQSSVAKAAIFCRLWDRAQNTWKSSIYNCCTEPESAESINIFCPINFKSVNNYIVSSQM